MQPRSLLGEVVERLLSIGQHATTRCVEHRQRLVVPP
jgi:hypothetical protein